MTMIDGLHERRYRRLLWAYPSGYRREHGVEIVTTLLDMAEAGHGRPTAGQTLHLVACGIRQRFRVPRRVLAVSAAVLSAATLGGLGAVTGNWLAWQAAAPVPSTAEMTALTSAMTGMPRPRLEPWRTAMNGPGMISAIEGTGTYDPERVRTALIATGWQITTFEESAEVIGIGVGTPDLKKVPARALKFTATKDGLSLEGATDTIVGGKFYGRTSLALDVTTDVTGAIRPSTVAGLLLGVLGGWLLAAALAYRIRMAGGSNRWTASCLTALALIAAAVPAFVAYCEAYQIMVYDVHNPNQYVAYSISDTIPMSVVLIGAGVAALALVAAVRVADRRSEPELTPVSS